MVEINMNHKWLLGVVESLRLNETDRNESPIIPIAMSNSVAAEQVGKFVSEDVLTKLYDKGATPIEAAHEISFDK